jgi:hypothetical protein
LPIKSYENLKNLRAEILKQAHFLQKRGKIDEEKLQELLDDFSAATDEKAKARGP